MSPGSGIQEPLPVESGSGSFLGRPMSGVCKMPPPSLADQRMSGKGVLVVGKLLAGTIRSNLRAAAFFHNLELTLEEESSWLQVTFMFRVEGSGTGVMEFKRYMEELGKLHE